MTPLLLVLNFLAKFAGLLLLDCLSGFTDLRSMPGLFNRGYATAVVRMQHCSACLWWCSLVSGSCLAADLGEPDARLVAARLFVAAVCTGEAALILVKSRADTAAARPSVCCSRAASNSLTALPVSDRLAENKQGVCKEFAQLEPDTRLLGDLIMRTESWVRRHRSRAVQLQKRQAECRQKIAVEPVST